MENSEHHGIMNKCQAIMQCAIYDDLFYLWSQTTVKIILPARLVAIFHCKKMAGKDIFLECAMIEFRV